MLYNTRPLKREDAEKFSFVFASQGLNIEPTKFLAYYSQQQAGKRKVFIAEFQGEFLGFGTIIPNSLKGAFVDMNIPEITDLYILKKYQNQGVASFILKQIEDFVLQRNDSVCVAVPVNKEFGISHKMFALRGYIPDCSGVWYGDKNIDEMENTVNDKNLCVYFKKDLKKFLR